MAPHIQGLLLAWMTMLIPEIYRNKLDWVMSRTKRCNTSLEGLENLSLQKCAESTLLLMFKELFQYSSAIWMMLSNKKCLKYLTNDTYPDITRRLQDIYYEQYGEKLSNGLSKGQIIDASR